jgi:transposase
MKVPVKFVSLLEEEKNELESIEKHSTIPRVRQRARAILSSSRRYSIEEIASIGEVHRLTVSRWIDNWNTNGLNGLKDKERPGAPSILTEAEKELVIELANSHSRSIPKIIAEVFQKTGKRISNSTVKRLLKAADFGWKRIKKIVKDKRDQDDFDREMLEIEELKKQHQNSEIE